MRGTISDCNNAGNAMRSRLCERITRHCRPADLGRKQTSELMHFSFATGRCSERRIKDLRKRLIAIGLEILEAEEPGVPVILAGIFTPMMEPPK